MVISPSDWKVSTLGNIGTFTKGAPLSKADISETGTPFVLYGELYTTYNEVTYKIYRHTKRSVDSLYYSNIGDVIIPTSGETAEEIATACCIMVPGAILAGDLNIYRANGFDGRYVSYVINHIVNRQIADVAQGISIIHVNAKELKKIEIHYPELPEQKAIANTLDTFDTHIANLAELIEKKKAIREGALEDLMSGRTRLDGFNDRWHSVRLGEICSLITKGTTPLDKSGRGNINFIKVENIDPSSGNIRINQKITTAEHTGYLKRSQLQADDILFSIAGTLGRVTVIKKENLPANTNQALAIIRLKAGHRDYVKYFLTGESIKTFIKENPTVGAQPNLSLKQVGSLEIKLPSMKEQETIADVLTAMDDEIKALEAERDKMIQIREGVMDDLLTGRVRLRA